MCLRLGLSYVPFVIRFRVRVLGTNRTQATMCPQHVRAGGPLQRSVPFLVMVTLALVKAVPPGFSTWHIFLKT